MSERGQWDGKRLADTLRLYATTPELVAVQKNTVRELREAWSGQEERARTRFGLLTDEKRAEIEKKHPEILLALFPEREKTPDFDKVAEAWQWDMEASAPVAQEIRKALERVPVISADNVAEYMYRDGTHPMGIQDFPALAPPFPAFWVEVRKTPTRIAERITDTLRWGALFRAEKLDEGGWRMTAHHVLSVSDALMVLDKPTVVNVAADGTPTSWELPQGFAGSRGEPDDPDRFEFAAPLLMAVAFMNCANVEHYEVEPPRALSLKRERKHGKPLVRYRVIEISPKTRAQAGDGPGTGDHKALHICRGHFARYTAEAPLFGHFVGTVWKPAHVRGRASQGVVKKDYRVTVGEAPS